MLLIEKDAHASATDCTNRMMEWTKKITHDTAQKGDQKGVDLNAKKSRCGQDVRVPVRAGDSYVTSRTVLGSGTRWSVCLAAREHVGCALAKLYMLVDERP